MAILAGLAAALKLTGLAAAGALVLYGWVMDGRLLRALPGQAAEDPALVRYARWRAAPALRQRCAACHGQDLKGDPARGAPNLVDRDWVYGDGEVADIEQTVLYGVRSGHRRARNLADMPAFARAVPYRRYAIAPLSAGEIHDVVDYLLSIEGRPADRAAASRGAAVYSGKGQCFDCHTPDASGDNFAGAPNLRDRVWMNGDGSRASLIDIVSYGRAGVCPAWAGVLRPAVIRAIAVDLHAASIGSRP